MKTSTGRPAALFLFLALCATALAQPKSGEPELARLNEAFARAFVASDAAVYSALLAGDFQAVLADGRRINREEFLLQAASPSGASGFRLGELSVRQYGETAVMGALADYLKGDGTPVRTRYTGVWVKSGGRWRMVSVQFTRAPAPPPAPARPR